MAESFEFRIDGLEELQKDLEKAIKRYPTQAEDTLKSLAKKFKKSAKKKAEAELKPHNRADRDNKKAIKAKWGTKIVGENQGMAALVYNSARHFHLVENGHNLVKGGRVIGFVAGKHIMEKTRDDYEDIIPKEFQEMVDHILRESDLD